MSGEPTTGVRVMVVDDHPMWREGVARDLTEAGHLVVATSGEGRQAVRVAAAARPDLVVLDLQLPDISGVAVIHGLRAALPRVRVLMLSASGEQQGVLDAVKAGATGYLLKSAAPAEFLDAVRRTAAGEPVFTPAWPVWCWASTGGSPPALRPAAPATAGPARHPGSPNGRPRCCDWWPRGCPTSRSPAGSGCPTAPCRTTCRTRWASSSCTTGSS